MLLVNIAKSLNLKPRVEAGAEVEVKFGYASDLLSDVLAKTKNGTLWLTNQKHQNIVGVSVMLDLAGVVIVGGVEPEENTLEKAIEENIPIYITDMSLFDLTGKLYELGLRSSDSQS